MSLSDVYRDRYYEPGYVYIAGSLSSRLIKIGTTKNIEHQEQYLRKKRYGSVSDWILLYYVWVKNAAGKIEHDARRVLRHSRELRMYEKDGRTQKGRELVSCDFCVALKALSGCLSDKESGSTWRSMRCDEFDFDRRDAQARALARAEAIARVRAAAVSFKPIFLKKVEDLKLSVRSANCLRINNIVYFGDLVQTTEAEMLRMPTFGRKSVNEIKEALAKFELQLGLKIVGWLGSKPEVLAMFIGTPFLDLARELELSVRTANCLTNDGIIFIGDLVRRTEAQMLDTPNFGRKSLNEIKEVLAERRLHFGMEVVGWPRS